MEVKNYNKSVHITEDHWEQLKLIALKNRTSVREILDHILEEYLRGEV